MKNIALIEVRVKIRKRCNVRFKWRNIQTDPVHCIGGGTERHPHNSYACSVLWSIDLLSMSGARRSLIKHAYISESSLTPTSCRSATRNVCTITSNVASQAISLDSSTLRTHHSILLAEVAVIGSASYTLSVCPAKELSLFSRAYV